MPTDHRTVLAKIKRFDQLIAYLRDEMAWPIDNGDFEELTFEYTPEELGIGSASAANIQEIKRLRPLSPNQPWGIFFIKFEPKKLPVVALRRILSRVALKKRASANSAERAAWAADDLLFVSNFGEGDERQISFAHFSQDGRKDDLPTLKILGWDNLDTPLHLDHVAELLTERLAWPHNDKDVAGWRESWRSAFTLRHREVISTSKALAVRLAELARAIRDRIKTVLAIETENGPVTKLMKAFQQALVHDLGAGGFADMYAQTIAYGLLSARVTDPRANTADGFAVQLPVTNPFLKELMETFLHVGGRKKRTVRDPGIDFDELGVSEVVELLDDANMEAVVRDFGDRNPQEDPVIHFYELFLKEYDAEQKAKRGVFYTPRPVVSYIVRSVHELLQTEFGLADGLADVATWGEMAKRNKGLITPEGVRPTNRFVTILDPATGTGTFLVETIDVIHRTLVAKWKGEGHGERMMIDLWNEYVPKHLLPRLHGYELLMAPYAIAHLKIGLKLFETGYRFGSDERARIYLTNSLEPASDSKKQMEFREWLPALAHEAEAVNEIKRKQRFTVVIGNPPYSRASVNTGDFVDELIAEYKDRVREERNIQPLSDDYIKFIGFAQYLLRQSQSGVSGMITNNTFLSGRLHRGMRQVLLRDNRLLRVLNLHGSQKVGFLGAAGAGDQNVFDILQGVSISLVMRGSGEPTREYCELVGRRADKYERLLKGELRFSDITPNPSYYLLVPWISSGIEYQEWPALSDIILFQSVSGKPGDDELLIAIDKDEVIPKLRQFKKELASTEERDLTEAGRNFAALDLSSFDPRRIVPYAYRPFDTRYAYYDPRIWTRPLERLRACIDGSPVLLTTKLVKDAAFAHVFVTRIFPDVILLSNTSSVNCYAFPRRLPLDDGSLRLGGVTSNYQTSTLTRSLGKPITDDEFLSYIYGVLHSPSYREGYLESLRLDFPRIPIPGSTALLLELTRLGGELVSLHLMESKRLDDLVTTQIGPKNPEVGRVGWSRGTVWLDAAATRKGQPSKPGTIGFRGVPEAVWNFHIGSYQVCEKWLKDRKGRTLSKDDIAHYQKIVVAIAETIRIMKEIDEVIEQHGGWPGAFQGAEGARKEPLLRKVAEETRAPYKSGDK